MKRPMCVIGFTFALVLRAAFFCTLRQALALSGACAATALLLFVLHRLYARRTRALCLACLSAAGAFAWFGVYQLRHVVPFEALSGQTLTVQGIVTRVQPYANSTAYTLRARLTEHGTLPPTGVTVRSYGEQQFREGDVLRLQATLLFAQESASGRYLLQNGIALTGTLGDGPVQRVPPQGIQRLHRMLLQLRQNLYDNVYAHIPGDHGDIVTAMVLGNQDSVRSELYTDIGRAGTVHLLSVSGMHLSIVAALVWSLLRGLRVPERAGALLVMLACALFTSLTGLSAPMVRALAMLCVVLLGKLLARRADGVNSLAFSLFVLCLLWPQWVLGKGLWLSAGSTLGIVLFSRRATQWLDAFLAERSLVAGRITRPLFISMVISVCAYVCTFPVLLLTYGWVSLLSPFANALVAPFVTPLMLGGMLCALSPHPYWPLQAAAAVAEACTRMILELSRLVSRLPLATAALDESYMLLWLLGVGVVAGVLLATRAGRQTIAAGVAVCVLLYSAGGLSLLYANRTSVELATVTDCDTAVLLRDGDAVLLGMPDRYEATRLMKYLDFRGVRRIAAVIAPDCGEQVGSGLSSLHKAYGIDCVIGPNDGYILDELALALPGIPVYSGGYATTTVLGGVQVDTFAAKTDLLVRTGTNSVLKKRQEYGILKDETHGETAILYDGGMLRPGNLTVLPEPVGRTLYGETRVLLRLRA